MRDVLAKMRDFPHDCGMVDTYVNVTEVDSTTITVLPVTVQCFCIAVSLYKWCNSIFL